MSCLSRLSVSAVPLLLSVFALAACGGGGGGGGSTGSPSDPSLYPTLPSTVLPATPTPLPSMTQTALALPASVANGSVVALECGRTYRGTLDLRGKSDVTVRTTGDCGNAIISPGQPVTGWTRHEGNIYSAAVSFEVAQVIADGQSLEQAHWPNRPQTWARANSASGSTLTASLPNPDLVGATLVFRPYDWAIEARRISAVAGNTLTLAALNNINFDGHALSGAVDYYVEGKLWMLDAAGEWAVSGNRLYVWMPDGLSPEGRIWAAPERDAIDASNARRISVQGVTLYGAANGINALNASHVQVADASIANVSGNGILNNGGFGLVVERTTIRNVRHDGIAVKWGGGAEVIRNNRIEHAGAVGMPTNAHAAINLTLGSGAQVQNNVVLGAGYIGVRVFRNAVVDGNTIDHACTVLADCGCIYADAAMDGAPLHTRIENNAITRIGAGQRLAWGIFLGERANAVTVSGNTTTGSGNGMQLLNAFDNRISGNTFSRNVQAQIQMVEYGSSAAVAGNTVSGNRYTMAGREEAYRLSSERGSAAVAGFASYAANAYVSSSSIFANYQGEALSYPQWRARTGQDGQSTMAPP